MTAPNTSAARAAARPGSGPKMLWDLVSLGTGQALSVVLGFAAFAYLARTLTPDAYGVVEYAVGLAGLAAIVIEGGMGPIGTLHVARDHGTAGELAGSIPAARLLVAAVLVPIVAASGFATGLDRQGTLLVALFAISLLAMPFKQDWLLQGLDRMTFVAPAQSVKSAAFAVGTLLFVHGSADLARIGLIEAIAALLMAAYFLIVQQRVLGVPLAIGASTTRAWELIRTGASIGASNMLWPFMVYVPILVVTNLADSAEAAWLGAAQRIVVALVAFSALYFVNLYPVMGRGLREDPAVWQRLMRSSFRLVAWSSIGFATLTALLANVIVTLVFGDTFVLAGPVLAIYIWVLPLRLLSGHARWTLIAAERQHTLLMVELACAGAIVLLAVALIPGYGSTGAALAAVLGNVFGWTLAHIQAGRQVGRLPGMQQIAAPAAVAIVAVAVATLAGAGPVVSLGLAAGVYGLGIWLLASDLFSDAVRLAYAKKAISSTGER